MSGNQNYSNHFTGSFDAKIWAVNFVDYVKSNPGIATDVETMTTWFANALMRGFDEGQKDKDQNHE